MDLTNPPNIPPPELIQPNLCSWLMIPLVEVQGLVKDYGSLRAVQEVSFEVYPGDVLGFLGPNGAGKSTTLRMLLSLIRPTQGSIQIFGKDLISNRTAILSKIGCIIEKPDFYKYLTARQNLQLFARWSPTHIPSSRISELLDFVGLGSRGNHRVGGFSHGMRQRLGLAQALLNNPDLIILDEPTTGLDPQGIIEVRELILKLKQETNKTIILSSHLLSEIELIANRVVILNKGKALVQGEVSELVNASELLVSIQVDNGLKAQEALQQSRFSGHEILLSNQEIQLKTSRQEIPEILGILMDNGISIYAVESKRKLEDYFLKLTSN